MLSNTVQGLKQSQFDRSFTFFQKADKGNESYTQFWIIALASFLQIQNNFVSAFTDVNQITIKIPIGPFTH